MTNNEDKSVYFHGFDYLRILFALFIVAFHIKLFGTDGLFSAMHGTYFIPSLYDILYFNVFLIAVPLFLLLSLFLYIYNRKSKQNYFVKRSKHIFFLYLFWTLAALAFNQEITLRNLLSIGNVISGAGSVTYFLFEILIMTAIVELMLQLKPRIKSVYFKILIAFLLGVSSIFLAIMSFISGLFNSHFAPLFLSYCSPLNFFPYPFLAIIFYELYNVNNNVLNIRQVFLIFFAMVLSIILEWKTLPSNNIFFANGYLLPAYSRLSLIFAAILLLIFFINFNVDGGKVVKTLSEMTLGVFLVHLFIIRNFSAITPGLAIYMSNNMPLHYAVIVGMSFGLVYCIKRIKIV